MGFVEERVRAWGATSLAELFAGTPVLRPELDTHLATLKNHSLKLVTFDAALSAMLAACIAAFGVDMVECGHAKISEAEVERIRSVVATSPVPVLTHARCRIEDFDAALPTGAPWIGVFASFNDISLATKFKGTPREDVTGMFKGSIACAKRHGLTVRATIEDEGAPPCATSSPAQRLLSRPVLTGCASPTASAC